MSLFEVLLCLSLVSMLLMGVGLSGRSWAQKKKVDSDVVQLEQFLKEARSVSLSVWGAVVLKRRASDHWVAFLDANHNGLLDDRERIVSVLKLGASGAAVSFQGFGRAESFEFNSQKKSTHQNGRFDYVKNQTHASFVVSKSGRVRRSK